MNIVEVAQRHGPLLERILARATGPIGEILVADALTARGYDVKPTPGHARQDDLTVRSPAGAAFSVEVKTDRARRPTWFVRTCPDPERAAFWIFVVAPRDPAGLPDPAFVEFYVLTVEEVRALWLANPWNQQNPTKGDVRRHQISGSARDAWHKLPA